MKLQNTLRLATLSMVLATGLLIQPAIAGSANGVWKTEDGTGIEIYACGSALCGKSVSGIPRTALDIKNKNSALRNRPLLGLEIMTGFVGGPERWTGGKIYNPDDGATYSGSLFLRAPNALDLTGCVVAPICKKQTWTRIK